jgi:non-canonical poly(A) RNA polymerase PAPD5/7
MSSFVVFNLVLAYHQYLMKNNDKYPDNYDIGLFFQGFMQFFAEEFNYTDLGISLRDGGYFFMKNRNNKLARNNLLCIENFQDQYHDIAKGTYRYESVKFLFKEIYYKLQKANDGDSYLASLIRLNKFK